MFQLTTQDHHRFATTNWLTRKTGRAPAAIALLCSVALLPLAAQADGLQYSYVEAGYVETDVDDVDASLDGFSLRGSFEITDDWFVFAGYTDQSYGGLDLQDYGAGVGYAWSVADTTDLYGKLSYVRTEADIEGFSLDDDGYAVALGVRSLFGEHFELEASVDYSDLSLSGDDTNFGVGARWYFVKHFALGIEATTRRNATVLGANVRWAFDN